MRRSGKQRDVRLLHDIQYPRASPQQRRVRAPILALSVDGKIWALSGRSAQGDLVVHVDRWLPADLGGAQPAWVTALNAVTPPGIAGWARSVGLLKSNVPAGRIFCHTPTYVQWTSPIAGEIEIGGGLWLLRNLGRIQKWELQPQRIRLPPRTDCVGANGRFAAAVCGQGGNCSAPAPRFARRPNRTGARAGRSLPRIS